MEYWAKMGYILNFIQLEMFQQDVRELTYFIL